MIAIKESVDRGGVDSLFAHMTTSDLHGHYANVFPGWKDREQIAPEYLAAIATDANDENNTRNSSIFPNATIDNVPWAFGAIAMFYPKRVVKRADAALCIADRPARQLRQRPGPLSSRGPRFYA